MKHYFYCSYDNSNLLTTYLKEDTLILIEGNSQNVVYSNLAKDIFKENSQFDIILSKLKSNNILLALNNLDIRDKNGMFKKLNIIFISENIQDNKIILSLFNCFFKENLKEKYKNKLLECLNETKNGSNIGYDIDIERLKALEKNFKLDNKAIVSLNNHLNLIPEDTIIYLGSNNQIFTSENLQIRPNRKITQEEKSFDWNNNDTSLPKLFMHDKKKGLISLIIIIVVVVVVIILLINIKK